MNLPALVLAAGHSTRIEPLAAGVPKPLLEVGGRSLLEWNLRWLGASGITEIWINLHHRAATVRTAARAMAPAGVELLFSEEVELLGTAGGWRRASRIRARLAARKGGWLVVYGDNLMRFDLGGLHEAHRAARKAGAVATVALFDPSRHRNTGIGASRVELAADGRVERFEEERGGSAGAALVNAGVYVLEPEVVDSVGDGVADFGTDVFPALVARGALYGHVMEAGGFCLGLDTPEHFEEGRRLVESGAIGLK